MTKEEVALQLTLARIEKLMHTETRTTGVDKTGLGQNATYNEMLAEETVKLFNAIYNGIAVDSSK